MRICWLQERAVAPCVGVILILCGHVALADEKPANNIDDLLKKRLVMVEEVRREMMVEIYAGGHYNWLDLRDATVAVLNARLELAKSPKDRIKVFEDILKMAEDLKDLASNRMRSGQGKEIDALRAKVLVLEVQIDLERSKKNPG